MASKDFVIARSCDGKCYVYEAPAWSCIKPGTELEVGGMLRPVAVMSDTLNEDSEELKAMLKVCKQKKPGRVYGYFNFRALEYDDEEVSDEAVGD